jgi:hypothetical protein
MIENYSSGTSSQVYAFPDCKGEGTTMTATTANTSTEPGRSRIIERRQGFYWQDSDGLEYGPFATLAEAEADRQSAAAAENSDATDEPPEETEGEIGMADWLDPETGEPGEQFAPRIEDN